MKMRMVSFDQSDLLTYSVMPSRLHVFTRPCLYFLALLFLSGSAPVFGNELSANAAASLKKVTISKPSESVHGMNSKKTEATFLVEVIRDMQGLKKGLSHRESMPERSGMLFVLDASQEHAFWMKGMRFPLDIIFIGTHLQITEILENLQPCKQCPLYIPKEQPAYVLEINAGLARKFGLSIGDAMVLEK
ncbi:MAG: DUF192 domain-containing protein [Nitrospirae bacterium]|nr:DUF192 domain-containing protein [Nitrospirota bacterium]